MKLKFGICMSALLMLAACNEEKKAEKPQEAAQVTIEKKSQQEIKANQQSVFFKNIKSGDTLTNPVKIEFGIHGMKVEKAGQVVEGTGHHHLLIDVDSLDMTQPIPSDDKHKHFGGGQTETTIELTPGPHKLKLLFANGVHVPHAAPLMAEIEVFVK